MQASWRLGRRSAMGVTLGLAAPGLVRAQGARTITIIVPFAPGASADGVARLVGAALGQAMRQTVVVENRPGAGGSLGLGLLARAAPDGQTLGVGATGAVVINPHTSQATGLDPLRQLAPVARLAGIPLVLVTGPATGLNSVPEIIARSRAVAGGLSFGTTGTNSAQHLATELLARATQARLTHIPYRGSAPAVTDVLSGTLPLACVDLTSAAGGLQADTLVGVATTGPRRSALAPGIPTVAEQGLPGFSATAWLGLFAPAGTDTSRLSAEVEMAMAQPALRERILALSAEPDFAGDAGFGRFLHEESDRWRGALAGLGVRE